MSAENNYNARFEVTRLSDSSSDSSDSSSDSSIHPTKARALQCSQPMGGRSLRRSPSPDEYEAYDLSEFSAADFAELDQLISGMSRLSIPENGRQLVGNGSPAVHIGLEDSDESSKSHRPESSQDRRDMGSPYETFRSSTGVLSVTDITGPAW